MAIVEFTHENLIHYFHRLFSIGTWEMFFFFFTHFQAFGFYFSSFFLITRIMPLVRITRACQVPILLTPVCTVGVLIANWREGIWGPTRRFNEIQSVEKNNIKEPKRFELIKYIVKKKCLPVRFPYGTTNVYCISSLSQISICLNVALSLSLISFLNPFIHTYIN